MKHLLSTFMLFVICSSYSFAQSEVYLCVDANGKKEYKTTDLTKGCKLIDVQPINEVTGSTPAKKTTPSPAFCSTIPGGECIEDKRFTGIYKGIKFILHEDGSGSVQGNKGSDEDMGLLNDWHILCKKDVISRKKSCFVSKSQGNLIVYIYPGNTIRVFAGDNHYPGTRTSIRINDDIFHTTTDDAFPKSAAIASKMKDGAEIALQWVEWPYRYSKNATYDVYGFQTALAVAKWSLSNLK